MKKESAELYAKLVDAINPILKDQDTVEAIEALTMLLAVGLCSAYEFKHDAVSQVYNIIVKQSSDGIAALLKSTGD